MRNRKPSKKHQPLRQKIATLVRQNKSDWEICKQAGCSPSLVTRIRCGMGYHKRRVGNLYDFCTTAYFLLQTAETYSQIGERVGRSKEWIGKVAAGMRRAGFLVPPRKVGRPKKQDTGGTKKRKSNNE